MAAPEKYKKALGASRAEKIYKRGLGAYYSSGSRPGMSANAWDVARLKAHGKGNATRKKAAAE